MADYYPLLARAVAALPDATLDTRRSIYERARKALLGQLRSLDPPMAEADLQAESDSLDAAIARLEGEIDARAAESESPSRALELVDARAPAAPTLASPAASPASPPRALSGAGSGDAPGMPAGVRLPPPPFAPPPPRSPAPSLPPARPRPLSPMSPAGHVHEVADTRASAPPSGPKPLADLPEHAPVAIRAPGPARSESLQSSLGPGIGANARGDQTRPAAPSGPGHSRAFPRTAVWLPILLVICGGIGFAAWRLRVPTEEFARARPPQTPTEQSAKLNERADRPPAETQEPSAAQRAQQGVTRQQAAPGPAAQPSGPGASSAQPAGAPQRPQAPAVDLAAASAPQRAALLVQGSLGDQQNIDTHVGTTLWRNEASQRSGGAPQPAVRADVDVGAVGVRLSVLIEKNNDPTLRASHTMTFRFITDPEGRLPAVAEIGTPQVRNESAQAVDALAGVQAKITDNIFIVALTGEPAFAARNVEMMRTRGWFDFPLRLADGRIAKITIEKGPSGERAFDAAFEAWQK